MMTSQDPNEQAWSLRMAVSFHSFLSFTTILSSIKGDNAIHKGLLAFWAVPGVTPTEGDYATGQLRRNNAADYLLCARSSRKSILSKFK